MARRAELELARQMRSPSLEDTSFSHLQLADVFCPSTRSEVSLGCENPPKAESDQLQALDVSGLPSVGCYSLVQPVRRARSPTANPAVDLLVPPFGRFVVKVPQD